MTVWELIDLLETQSIRQKGKDVSAWEIISTLERIRTDYGNDTVEGAALDAAIGLVSGLLAVGDDGK